MTGEQAIDVAGYRGCWRATGDGPVVVILATPFVLARSYEPTAAALGKRFRVISIQLPGSGRAAKLPTPWTVAEYGQWAGAALEALDLRPTALVGHSHSGAIAMQVAADRPERVSRLVLADTVGGAGPGAWRTVLQGRVVDGLLEPRLTFGAWHHLLYNVFAHFRNFRAQMAQAIGADVRELAAQVQVPTLLAWGAHDHTMPLDGAASLYRRLARRSLYVAPTGSHDWLIDHAEEFAAAVGDFVDRTAARGAPNGCLAFGREHHELAR